jgi:hypothetical protein
MYALSVVRPAHRVVCRGRPVVQPIYTYVCIYIYIYINIDNNSSRCDPVDRPGQPAI